MAMRDVEITDFAGKTISTIDNSSSNVIRFYFTDGTTVELWTEVEYNSVPFFMIDTNPIEAVENNNDQ